MTDITARKKAEAYLEYLGTHDVLTKLYNRSFYIDEVNRLERKGFTPVTIIIADLNGLKMANDQYGYSARRRAAAARAGEVLDGLVEKPCCAARIGGDEFAILMPNADEQAGEAMMENIHCPAGAQQPVLQRDPAFLSMGAATSRLGERLESTRQTSRRSMHDAKRRFYAAETRADRRDNAAAGMNGAYERHPPARGRQPMTLQRL